MAHMELQTSAAHFTQSCRMLSLTRRVKQNLQFKADTLVLKLVVSGSSKGCSMFNTDRRITHVGHVSAYILKQKPVRRGRAQVYICWDE